MFFWLELIIQGSGKVAEPWKDTEVWEKEGLWIALMWPPGLWLPLLELGGLVWTDQ